MSLLVLYKIVITKYFVNLKYGFIIEKQDKQIFLPVFTNFCENSWFNREKINTLYADFRV